ncbi:MAG: phosphoglycerate kinase [Candidatus Eisenbacteria bacterium]|nr:phosphoglycerate kinase [Candidatus Eisenbacteria bacterium]
MKLNKIRVGDLDIRGKRIFTRVDFNVPLAKTGSISDDTRIVASLPTIKYMAGKGGRIVLTSHLGRPDGKKVPEMSLKPVSERLAGLLGKPVAFTDDCISADAKKATRGLKDGEVLLLENLRFYKEEEKNDEKFSASLAEHGELYVNDAFGTAHRAHASTVGVTRFMKQSAAGFLMEKEITNLGRLLENPERPFAGIIGGAKVSDKVKMIRNLLGRLDMLIIGGAMMFTFLKANGKTIGKSFFEEKSLDVALEIMKEAKKAGTDLIMPSDCVVSESLEKAVNARAVSCEAIPDNVYGVDIGPASREEFSKRLGLAKTIFWNGPLGIFEIPEFSEGTLSTAKALGKLGERGVMTVVGGGDSASAISKAGVKDKVTHVSTGGGASLEFLEGNELPGVAALTDRSV